MKVPLNSQKSPKKMARNLINFYPTFERFWKSTRGTLKIKMKEGNIKSPLKNLKLQKLSRPAGITYSL